MNIKLKDIKEFKEKDLEYLFLSVNWSSGKHPEKLKISMKNSDTVISAWDGDRLIGLMNALSDKIMTVYFHYLLVDPEYHGNGIGKKIINKMLENYNDYARKVIIAYDERIGFYKNFGFELGDGKSPMFITYFTT